jgi:hypothetical protein
LQTKALHHVASSAATTAASSSAPRLSMYQTARSLYREGGPLIFWRGMTANLMGLSHVGVQFPVYEQLKKVFKKHKARESALDLLFASGLSKMTACIHTHLPSRRKVRSKSVCSALLPHGARHPSCSLTALWRFSNASFSPNTTQQLSGAE